MAAIRRNFSWAIPCQKIVPIANAAKRKKMPRYITRSIINWQKSPLRVTAAINCAPISRKICLPNNTNKCWLHSGAMNAQHCPPCSPHYRQKKMPSLPACMANRHCKTATHCTPKPSWAKPGSAGKTMKTWYCPMRAALSPMANI